MHKNNLIIFAVICCIAPLTQSLALTINTEVNATQTITDGDFLEVQSSGYINPPGGDDGVDLDNNATTITVRSGGRIGGLDSLWFDSGGTISGAITIENGGILNGTDDGIDFDSGTTGTSIANSGSITGADEGMIFDDSSGLSGSLTNTGTITGSGDDGIDIGGTSFINGGISNTGGTIQGDDDAIVVESSSIQNGISNTGQILATSDDGIDFIDDVTFSGGISNSGTIQAGDIAIEIEDTDFTGDISNLVGGILDGNGDDCIQIWGDDGMTFSGGISNSGQIEGADDGIELYQMTFDGVITNEATGSINGVGDASGASGDGVLVDYVNTSGVHAGNPAGDNETLVIVNSGSIVSEDDGIDVDHGSVVHDGGGSGGIRNMGSGTIQSGGDGIAIKNGSIVSGISNSGSIISDSNSILVSADSVVDGISHTSGTLEGGLSILGTETGGGGVDLENRAIVDLKAVTGNQISGEFDNQAGSEIEILLATASIGQTVLSVSEDMTIDASAQLDLTFAVGFFGSANLGDTVTLFSVAGTLTGTFASMTEGSVVGTGEGKDLLISYAGGDGNDIVLTVAESTSDDDSPVIEIPPIEDSNGPVNETYTHEITTNTLAFIQFELDPNDIIDSASNTVVSAGSIPANLSIANESLSGSIPAIGTYIFTIVVSQGQNSVTHRFTISVIEPTLTPRIYGAWVNGIYQTFSLIEDPTHGEAAVTELFTYTIALDQAFEMLFDWEYIKGEASFRIVGGELPPGLYLLDVIMNSEPSGRISGTPFQAGEYVFVVSVMDWRGRGYQWIRLIIE
jgi:hypothetical protein